MELNLTDKVAVVTGASKGIGLAVTRALVAEGVYAWSPEHAPSPMTLLHWRTPASSWPSQWISRPRRAG